MPAPASSPVIRQSEIGEAARSTWRGLEIESSRRCAASFAVTTALRLAALAAALRFFSFWEIAIRVFCDERGSLTYINPSPRSTGRLGRRSTCRARALGWGHD